ncbi:MAG: SusC/RagA family protein [Mucilaginibacter sp.]|nr:SusC/RagA family protein [Mucilaginibacter sp.]
MTLALFVLLFFCHSIAVAQSLVAQGVVRDSKGLLPGVTVHVKDGAGNVATLADGTYKVNVTPDATLVFSFIGYTTREIKLSDYKSSDGIFKIDIDLTTADNNLNEVVVVGFATQKRINLTSAVATVSGKSLENRPVLNAVQSLQGMVPGLNITQNNGALDASPSINIRGTGSISSSSSAAPLVLIDGMDGSLTALNPQDIESVSVLKDASATAIYGSRGAFGVILVTTKHGKAGKVQVNYNNNLRFTSPVSLPKEMDSYTFALYFNDASANGGSGAAFTPEHLQRIKDFIDGKIKTTDIPSPNNPTQWADGYDYGNDNVDWFKAMYKGSAFSQEHNISLTGGNEKTTYYISGNYLGQKGLLAINQDLFNRYGITAKINTKISDILSANYTVRAIREETQVPSSFGGGFYEDLGRQGWPSLPLYDPNGYLFSAPSFALGLRDGGLAKVQRDNQYQQLQLVLQPIKGWVTTAELNYRSMNHFDHTDNLQTFNHDVAGNPIIYAGNSSVTEYAYKENYFESNIYSSYEKTIQKHYFKLLVGSQTESFQYRDVSASREGIIVAGLPTLNTTSGIDYYTGLPVPPAISGQYQDWSTAALFGRLDYNYAEKYLFEANLRYDGSSRFRSDTRWAWFPSFSAGWNIAKEDFLKDVQFINTLKPRVSYGTAGNENTNNWYPTYVTVPVNAANGGWLINGNQPNTAGAPGLVSSTLTWETVKSLNIGFDFGLLNNRLTGSFDWYNRKTLNMVGPAVELPVTLGTAVPPSNNTDLKTTGWELQVGWTDRLHNGLGYGFNLSLWDNQTTVTRYPNPTGAINTYIAGQKVGNIWGYTTIGIAKTQAEMDAHLATSTNGQTFFGSQWAAGDIMYADYNKDGKIDGGANTISNPGDQHVIGNSTPRYNFGLNMHFDYKGFDLSAFFQGVLKQDFWNGSYYFWGVTSDKWHSGGLVQNLDYFRGDSSDPLGQNLNAYYPRPIFGTGKNQYVQTGYLQNAAYIRLKNLQIGYSLPLSLTRKVGIQKVRVYVAGDNLWTGSSIAKMFDPETIGGGNNAENGIGLGNVYPLAKVVSFGLSVTF